MVDLGAADEGRSQGGRQFDFWLGRWRVHWDEGKWGTNHVSKVLAGKVIKERFDGRPGVNLQGISLSVYDAKASVWRQAWVDNSGAYLDFVGGWDEDRMVLSRQVAGEQGKILQRMVWHDIGADSLMWNWERSEDGGQNWRLVWQLRYQRLEKDDR